MKQKKVLVLTLIILFLLPLIIFIIAPVSADQNEDEKVALAYDWLGNEVSSWQGLNTKQTIFSLLALQCNSSAFNKGNTSLYDLGIYSQGKYCFGPEKINSQSQCTLTETALGKIAADEFNQDVEAENMKQWIIGQNKTFTNIDWYLQIDIEQGQRANCSIIYEYNGEGQEEEGFRIWENKTIDIDGVSDCFADAEYWFRAKKENEQCYNKDYTVKCWSGSAYYTVSWFYKKPGSEIIYVSGETQSAQPGYGSQEPDPIDTSLLSYCLTSPGLGSSCDYEGTAWATYALARQGNDEDARFYLPYLITMKDNNIKYFPDTFLFQLMGTSIYENKIKNEQKPQGYWLIQPIVYGRNYDTAHAVMALGLGHENSGQAKEWILSSQTTQGYWDTSDPGKNKIRDTAFILWVFWPDICPGGAGEDCESQGSLYTCRESCEGNEIFIPGLDCPFDYLCCKRYGLGDDDCILEQGACKDSCNVNEFELTAIECAGTKKCCKNYIDADCEEEVGGEFCVAGQMCLGEEVETYDSLTTLCCLDGCGIAQTCTEAGGMECNPNQGLYCKSGYEIPAIDTDYCCEPAYCDDASTMYCYELNGELCIEAKVCIDSSGKIPFVNTIDGSCCIDGECGVDDYCANIGEECVYGEECFGNVYVRTLDAEECCTSECVMPCQNKGGQYCYDVDEECSGGIFEKSTEGSRCCVGGTCKKGGAFPWWIIIIIIVLIGGGAAAYFLYFKKPRKPKKPKAGLGPGFPFARPAMRPRPGIRPGPGPSAPGQRRPGLPMVPIAPKKIPGGAIIRRPGIMMPKIPRPESKMPSGPPSIIRKIRPSPMLSRPLRLRPTTMARPKIKRTVRRVRKKIGGTGTKRKSKGKMIGRGRGESELEKTLTKLEKITKKARKKK